MNVSWRKTPMNRFCLMSSWWSQTANNNSRGPASSAVPGIMVMGSQLKPQSGTAQWWAMVLTVYHRSSPGLQVSRFCFCSEDDLVEGLLQNQAHLFLTTDTNEVQQASHKGQKVSPVWILLLTVKVMTGWQSWFLRLRLTLCLICSGVVSVLLDQEQAFRPSDQLRVMVCGDAIIQPDSGQQRLQVVSATSPWPLLSFPFLFWSLHRAWCYWIVKEDITLFLCRVSWLIWVRCGRGLTSSTPLWPLSWWRCTVAGTAAVAPWRCCDPKEWAWMRRTVWPGPREAPSCLCCDLTSCSITVLAVWRRYEVTGLDWIVWTNLQEKHQWNSENVDKEVKSTDFWSSK